MIKLITSTKILELLKQVILFNLFLVLFISCKAEIKNEENNINKLPPMKEIKNTNKAKIINDSISFYRKINFSIEELLISKKNIDSIIFGDCIYSFLNKKKDSRISKEDIKDNFDKLFDEEFENFTKYELIKKEVREYIGLYDSNISPLEDFSKTVYISFAVPVNDSDSEIEFSKIFWFRKLNDSWSFCGLTCSG